MKKKIIIDVATIYPGQGGAGGGIWSYAKNLILNLDQQSINGEIELICVVNKQFNLPLNNLKKKEVSYNLRNFLTRFFYINIYLPVYVYRQKGILHKLYFESPIFPLTKMLVTIHDCMLDFYKKRAYVSSTLAQQLKFSYFSFINKRAILKSAFIYTPSNFVKTEIINYYGVSETKVIVTPLATQNSDSKFSEETKVRKRVNIYCIAAFHKHKGHLKLLEIFEKLITTYRIDAHLYFRGHISDENYFQKIKSKIETSLVKESIHILEYKKQSSIKEIYSEADWVILLSEYEGFGLPVIEAQANKVPVICSDIPTFKEVAGNTVFYIKECETIMEAADKLNILFKDEDLKNELICEGFKNAERYNWYDVARKVIDIYKTASA